MSQVFMVLEPSQAIASCCMPEMSQPAVGSEELMIAYSICVPGWTVVALVALLLLKFGIEVYVLARAWWLLREPEPRPNRKWTVLEWAIKHKACWRVR
jgi:hypothetical protein